MSTQSEILAYLISQAKPEAAGKSAVDAAIKAYKRQRHPGAEKTKRKPISRALRFQIYKWQNGKCAECGEPLAIAEMDVDHLEPISSGGAHSVRNFRGVHRKHNQEKGSLSVTNWSKRSGRTVAELLKGTDGNNQS